LAFPFVDDGDLHPFPGSTPDVALKVPTHEMTFIDKENA